MDSPTGVDGVLVSDWTRKVGSLHLAVAGLVDVAVAIGLASLVLRGQLLSLLIDLLPTVVDEVELVANAPFIVRSAAWGGPVLSVLLLGVGALQLYSGWHAYRRRRWAWGIGSGIAGMVNPLALPLVLVAVVLLVLSKRQFADVRST